MLGGIGKWFAGFVATLLVGCASRPALEPVRLDAGSAQPSADVSDLAAVLAAAVTDDGRVDAARLAGVADRLGAQLRRMVVSGPDATPELYPTYGARAAYWLNARTAWSLELARLAGCPECVELGRILARPFPLNGRMVTLGAIDEVLLAEARRSGDFRPAACAPCVSVNYGPLPRIPFAGDGLDARLQEALDEFVVDQRRFVIDPAGNIVFVPPMLWACRELVLERYHSQFGPAEIDVIVALKSFVAPRGRERLERAVGFRALPQQPREELAIPKRSVFYPGRIGRIEP